MYDPFHPQARHDEHHRVMEAAGQLWRKRHAILLWGIGCGVATALYMLACAKPYTAEGLVRIDADVSQQALAITLESEMDFIRARSTLMQALARLGPNVDVYRADSKLKARARDLLGFGSANIFSAEGPQLTIDRLKVPDRLLNQKLTLRIDPNAHYTLLDANGTLLYSDLLADAQATLAPEAQPVELNISAIHAPPGQQFTLVPHSPKDIVAQLQSQLSMATVGRKEHAGFIRLAFASENAEFSKRFLAALMETYVARAYEQRADSAGAAEARLAAQLNTIRLALEQAEAHREAFQQRAGTVDMTEQMRLSLEQLMQVEAQIRMVTAKQKELGAYYTAVHPAQQAVGDQLRYLTAERTQLQQAIDRLPETQRELLRISREVETYKQMYEITADKLTELRTTAASITGYASIVDRPELSAGSGVFHYLKTIFIGMVIGLILGSVAIYITSFSPLATLTSSAQLAMLSELSVLGTLRRVAPLVPGWRGYWQPRRQRILDEHRDTRPLRDYLSLMDNLAFAAHGAPNPVWMLTSIRPGNASAVIAANIATLSAKEDKTLLVDCSMREHGIHSCLNVHAVPGLSDVMVGKAVFDAAVQTLAPNLYFIPGGTATSYGAPLLHQQLFVDILTEFGKTFQRIVLYCPGMREDLTTSPLTAYAGAIALILSPGEKLARIQRFLHYFRAQAQVKGVILDGMR